MKLYTNWLEWILELGDFFSLPLLCVFFPYLLLFLSVNFEII